MSRPLTVAALLLGGAMVLALGGTEWLTALAPTPTGAAALALTGASAAPAVTAAGLVLLAAALTLTIAGVAVGRIAAVAAATTSAGAFVQVLGVALDPAPRLEQAAAAATGVPELQGDATVLVPAWLAVAGLGAMVVVSLVAVPNLRTWPRGRSRFDRDGVGVADDSRARAMDDWDALGRGEDPTDGTGTLDPRRNT
ncbi:MAG: Trp biosynthesis-associated membrane protein [Actinomycetota bacterium]